MEHVQLPDDLADLSPDHIFDLFALSKLPLKTFCKRYHLPFSTLRTWRHRRRAGASAGGKRAGLRRLTLAQESLLIELARSESFDSARQLALAWQQDHQPEEPLLKSARMRRIFQAHFVELPHYLEPRVPRAPAQSLSIQTCRTLRYDYDCLPSLTPEQYQERRERRAQTRYRDEHRPVPQAEQKQHYPSDLSDEQWAKVAGLMQRPFATGRPPERPRDTLNAILYILHTGAPWRFLPQDHYPTWNTVARAFQRYRDAGIWEKLNDLLVEEYERDNPCEWPKVAIADSQSVETSEKGGPAVMMATRSERGESVTLW